MKIILCASVVLLAMLNPDRLRPDPNKEDVQALQGTWRAASVEQGGAAFADAADCQLVFEGDKFRVLMNGQVVQRGAVTRRDAMKNPKEFDFEYTEGYGKGQKMLGVYKINGATYTCCFAPADDGRPKEFHSPAGTNTTLNVLKRE
jgi:uncharacterized protein (TIGR03067 family)